MTIELKLFLGIMIAGFVGYLFGILIGLKISQIKEKARRQQQ